MKKQELKQIIKEVISETTRERNTKILRSILQDFDKTVKDFNLYLEKRGKNYG